MMRYTYAVGSILVFAFLVMVRVLTLVSPHRLPWLIGSGVTVGTLLSIPCSRGILRRLSASLDGHHPAPWYRKLGISKNIAFLSFPLAGALLGVFALFVAMRFCLSREAVVGIAIVSIAFFVAVWLIILIAVLHFERRRGCRVYLVADVGLCAIRNNR